MGLTITTWLDARLWSILENGQATPPLVRVGNRAKFSTAAGWLKDSMTKAPADYPHLAIEVGVSGTHSAYKQDPTLATESPDFLTDNLGANDFSIERVERVRVTLKSADKTIQSINELRECVVDDLMRSGPTLGPSSAIVGFGPFAFDQRRFNLTDRQGVGWLCNLNFPINLQQRGRATVRDEE